MILKKPSIYRGLFCFIILQPKFEEFMGFELYSNYFYKTSLMILKNPLEFREGFLFIILQPKFEKFMGFELYSNDFCLHYFYFSKGAK